MFYYVTIALTIISGTLYHILLKFTPGSVNPIISLTVTYGIAMMVTLLIYPFYPNQLTLIENVKSLNWASYALGFAIVGLEVGYILAYRLGWQISLAGIISNTAIAILLIPIGVFFLKEALSFTNIIGLIFCGIGLVLVNYK